VICPEYFIAGNLTMQEIYAKIMQSKYCEYYISLLHIFVTYLLASQYGAAYL